jgi:2-polyprenyl-6-methoxyphenol hydroxylase-like FAD-dependent oxidoreductase
MTPKTEVLIVGAGPTGLAMALWLTRLGVKVRIIDKAAEPGATSRALVVHARILEFYDQLDIANEIVDRGLTMEAVTLWIAGKKRARIMFGDMGRGISPFPYALIFPQDEHEHLLVGYLRELGVTVERLVGARRLRRPGREGGGTPSDAGRVGGNVCGRLHRWVRRGSFDRP